MENIARFLVIGGIVLILIGGACISPRNLAFLLGDCLEIFASRGAAGRFTFRS